MIAPGFISDIMSVVISVGALRPGTAAVVITTSDAEMNFFNASC